VAIIFAARSLWGIDRTFSAAAFIEAALSDSDILPKGFSGYFFANSAFS
jgi:hypothetical protein